MGNITKAHAGSHGNILDTYSLAIPDEIMSGMVWYRDAYRFCEEVRNSVNTIAGPSIRAVDTVDVANVVSLLSPRSKWDRNKQDALKLLHAYAYESPMEEVVIATFKANKTKAIQYIEASTSYERNVIMAGSGESKVPSFATCIHSYATTDVVCVDGHAIGVWLGYRVVKATAKGPAYLRIQEDYRAAAAEVGIMPHQMQAVTWLVYRRLHKIK